MSSGRTRNHVCSVENVSRGCTVLQRVFPEATSVGVLDPLGVFTSAQNGPWRLRLGAEVGALRPGVPYAVFGSPVGSPRSGNTSSQDRAHLMLPPDAISLDDVLPGKEVADLLVRQVKRLSDCYGQTPPADKAGVLQLVLVQSGIFAGEGCVEASENFGDVETLLRLLSDLLSRGSHDNTYHLQLVIHGDMPKDHSAFERVDNFLMLLAGLAHESRQDFQKAKKRVDVETRHHLHVLWLARGFKALDALIPPMFPQLNTLLRSLHKRMAKRGSTVVKPFSVRFVHSGGAAACVTVGLPVKQSCHKKQSSTQNTPPTCRLLFYQGRYCMYEMQHKTAATLRMLAAENETALRLPADRSFLCEKEYKCILGEMLDLVVDVRPFSIPNDVPKDRPKWSAHPNLPPLLHLDGIYGQGRRGAMVVRVDETVGTKVEWLPFE